MGMYVVSDTQRSRSLASNDLTHGAQLKNDNAMATLDAARRMSFRDHGSCSGGGVGRMLISHELKEVRL